MTQRAESANENTKKSRRDRPGDLGRRASVLTWLALGFGLVGVYCVRQIKHQPLPTLTSLLVLGSVLVVALVLALIMLKPDFAAWPRKRIGLFLTGVLFAVMVAFAAYACAYWWVERHGKNEEILYQLVAKKADQLDWKPVVGKGPAIRLSHPEPLFMSFGPGSQYPFPLLKGPFDFWLLGSDPDALAEPDNG